MTRERARQSLAPGVVRRERRRFVATLAATALAAALPGAAAAQAWPAKPLRFVVPFAPGGATDIIARQVAQKLAERLGQAVVVENRPGAGTTIGNAAVAKAAPDGYTLLFAPTPFAITPALYPDLPYDPQKDFQPVALLAVSPFILVTHPGVPAKTATELVALAKAKPGTLTFCSAGSGSVPHLSGELFRFTTGTEIVHVPYKGGGPAIVDLLAGQVSMMFATPIEVAPYVQDGRLRVLATTAAKRLPGYPDVPTLVESGLPEVEVYSFFGVLAPAGTPRPIVDRLATDLAAVMEMPDVRERFAAQSAEPRVLRPDAFADYLKRERTRCADIVKRSGAKVD